MVTAELQRREGAQNPLKVMSRFLARFIPGVTEDSLSQELASRHNTTVQGAHMLIISGITESPPLNILEGLLRPRGRRARIGSLKRPLQDFILAEADFAVLEHGVELGIGQMLRFMPDSVYTQPARRRLETQLRVARKARFLGLKVR